MFGIGKETECCLNCKHYRCHYGEDRTLMAIGHCTFPRIKPRLVSDVCIDFTAKNAPPR